MNKKKLNQNGSIIVSILIITIFLTTFIFGIIVLANQNIARSKQRLLLLQAQYAAESGADSAVAYLNGGNAAYAGTGATDTLLLTSALYKATYSVTVVAGGDAKEKIINATGKVYSPASSATPLYTRTIQVHAQKSNATSTSALVSRNILEIASSVKDIRAKDVFVNGFINLTKNTNNLIAENITVADKNTGATNCSVGGVGTLSKPPSFVTPGQTKTKITMAYNNCISPPGNTSNANFDVLANQTNISKIQSTIIPWTDYMDVSYQNSPTGCTDWTSGSFPRDIPSTGNTKKTHYPDNGTGVASACGTSGNLNLATGQYNIRDNVHLRANLCGSTGCTPTFNNPDATLKFVFIEGTINFGSLQTAAGSGPMVFISSGSDPVALAGACPYGGSVFLTNSGNTTAPNIYLIATNGICLSQTKFGAQPGLGGISGKNLYIATNSGSPFDLEMNLSFPVSQIPVDSSWRAVRYRRM